MATIASPSRTALIGFVILVFSMGVGRFAFTPLMPLMRAEDLLGVGNSGILASTHFIGYAMGSVLAGRLTSFPGATLALSLCVIGWATVAMGLTDTLSIWLFARWIAGFCSALVLVIVSTHLVRRLSEAGRPDLQGWVFAGVGGGIVVVGLATLMIMAADWPSEWGWLGFGVATLIATAMVLASKDCRGFTTFQGPGTEVNSRSAPAWRLLLPYGAMGAGYVIPATFLPLMAQQVVSSPLVFGWSWPIFGLAAAASTLISARLHAVYSNRRIWVTSQLIMAAGLIPPAVWPNITSVAISGICVGGTFMVITMAGIREAHRVSGAGAQRQVGAMTAAFALGQIMGPVCAGWTYDATGGFAYPLLLASAVLVVTLGSMIGMKPTAG
jgi:MFS family permease